MLDEPVQERDPEEVRRPGGKTNGEKTIQRAVLVDICMNQMSTVTVRTYSFSLWFVRSSFAILRSAPPIHLMLMSKNLSLASTENCKT